MSPASPSSPDKRRGPRQPRQAGRRRAGPRRRRLHPLVISLVALAVLGFVTFYAFNQSLPFVHGFTLHAMVGNSVNVRSGSPVRIAGIDVGMVNGVSPAGDASEISFTMDDQGLPVHQDATIQIRSRLFLEGGYYLQLDPGSPEAPVASDDFTIPQQQTSTPVQFYNVLSTFNSAARDSLRHLLDTVNEGFATRPGRPQSASGAGGLKAAIPQLTPVLKDVAWITRGLRGVRPGDVQTLLSATASVTSTLATNSTQLTALVRDLNRTSGALAATDGALGNTISGLDQTLRAAPASLVSIDRALPPTARLAAVLDPSLRVAPPLIATITKAVEQLQQVVSQPERGRLLRSLDTTLVQFPAILKLLGTAFPITKQVTDCLRTHIIPILNTQVPDGSLSTGRPLWQDFAHFLPSISGASGNFDANSPFVRVLAGAGTNSLGTAGALGSLPLIGQIVGSSPPGGGALLGARPTWVGTLTPAAFRPDAPCAAQKVPSLSAPAAAADLQSRPTAPAPPISRAALRAMLANRGPAARAGGHR